MLWYVHISFYMQSNKFLMKHKDVLTLHNIDAVGIKTC